MSDKELIKDCLQQVIHKSGYPSTAALRQRDYEHICDEIEKSSGTLISISTIKRLINGQFNQLPQAATLNAVAMYLGYKSWQEFRMLKQQVIQAPTNSQPQARSKARISLRMVAALALVLIFLLVVSLTYLSKPSTDIGKNVAFSAKKITANDIPNTVVFSYDVEKMPGDSFFIQQSWDKDRRVRIDKEGHTLTDIYYEPGYHNAKLMAGGVVVKTVDVHIPTNGWFFFRKPGLFRGMPTYISSPGAVHNGTLALTHEDIMRSGLPAGEENFYYYTLFPDKFEVSADNFRLKARIRFKDFNNIACPMIVHEVCAQKNSLYFTTTPAGCTSNALLNAGEHLLDGKTTDLSRFGGDVRQWQEIEVVVRNKQALFSIDGRQVFSLAYKESPGFITGLVFMSNGICEIDRVSLRGLDGKLVYENDFQD